MQRRLEDQEEFEVRIQFPHGIVAGVAPVWQQQADEVQAQRDAELAYRQQWGTWATLAFGALGLLFMLGGPAGLYVLWYRFGRDKPVAMVADYLPEPPDALTPGMAGTLLDEAVDMEDIIATLVDLARRQAISITEVQEDSFLRKGVDFTYRRERDDVELLPYERELLDAVFGRKQEIELSDLKNKFYTKLPVIKRSMYDAVTAAKLFPRNPETANTAGLTLQDYRDAITLIAVARGKLLIRTDLIDVNFATDYLDGVHPNALGGAKIYAKIVESI